jgi:hypothetical protein
MPLAEVPVQRAALTLLVQILTATVEAAAIVCVMLVIITVGVAVL